MKKPKYTDSLRYPNGYTPSGETNISKTFDRIRKELKCSSTTAEVKRLAGNNLQHLRKGR